MISYSSVFSEQEGEDGREGNGRAVLDNRRVGTRLATLMSALSQLGMMGLLGDMRVLGGMHMVRNENLRSDSRANVRGRFLNQESHSSGVEKDLVRGSMTVG
jgi:hypothetical protein